MQVRLGLSETVEFLLRFVNGADLDRHENPAETLTRARVVHLKPLSVLSCDAASHARCLCPCLHHRRTILGHLCQDNTVGSLSEKQNQQLKDEGAQKTRKIQDRGRGSYLACTNRTKVLLALLDVRFVEVIVILLVRVKVLQRFLQRLILVVVTCSAGGAML